MPGGPLGHARASGGGGGGAPAPAPAPNTQSEAFGASGYDPNAGSSGSNIAGSPSSGGGAATKSEQQMRKIFVGGLASTVTSSEFRAYFEQFGSTVDAVVMFDRKTQRSRGFGFITFEDEGSVMKVMQVLNHELKGVRGTCVHTRARGLDLSLSFHPPTTHPPLNPPPREACGGEAGGAKGRVERAV